MCRTPGGSPRSCASTAAGSFAARFGATHAPLVAFVHMYITTPGEIPNLESARNGYGVLRPGFAAFFPATRSRLLDTITGSSRPSHEPAWRSREKIDVPDDLVLEQIQFLPEERIDTLLREAHAAHPQSFLWEPREMTWRFGNAASMEVIQGDTSLWVPMLTWAEQQLIARILQHWRPE
ncbi:hypothetical protein ACN28E_07935 [Archangium lansingense]|uniref:hypothetical protein n=1 Tax=Archangium lansingense TaxID=2995310 RepID=UPI003B7C1CD5